MTKAKSLVDQSNRALAEAIKLGWALPGELKEPDFDALRSRADSNSNWWRKWMQNRLGPESELTWPVGS